MKVLAVKLGDLGDVLLATPALRALREARPEAHVTALVTPHGAAVLAGSDMVDEVLAFPKGLFDAPWSMARPDALKLAGELFAELRRRHFDAVLLFHHLTTLFGTAKHAALCWATGAPVRAGLDNGRGVFLTHRVRDEGFGAYHEAEYWLKVAGLLGAAEGPRPLEFVVPEADERWAERVLDEAPFAVSGPLVALHPGSGAFSTARRWPVANFTALARVLQARHAARLVLLGGPGEEGLTRTIRENLPQPALDLAGRTSVAQLGAVLARCALLVANDGGVMHLATAVGTPVVAVFGPSNHRAWGPWTAGRSPAEVVRLGLACSPCFYVGHGLGLRNGRPPWTCLRELAPELVLAAVERLLECHE